METSPDRLYADPGLVGFYDIENGDTCELALLGRLAGAAGSVLDLGCGTGRLAVPLAAGGRRVVGVDPAGAMLDVARRKAGGAAVAWVRGDARCLELGERFDLVLLGGHTFQVFLSEQERLAVLGTIARHLAPAGRFVFDSRNPLAEEWKAWTPAESRRALRHPSLGEVVAWNDAVHDPASGIVEYGTYYRSSADGRSFATRSRIAFPARERLATLIGQAGLAVGAWLGDWQGRPFDASSPEIIPVGGLAGRAIRSAR